MLKIIRENDKDTFIYRKPTLPLIFVGIALLIPVVGLVLFQIIHPGEIFILFVSAFVFLLLAYFLFRQKQVLVIDRARALLEEYVGRRRISFSPSQIEFADVERFRDVGPLPEDSPESMQAPSLHLNYHLFVKLKPEGTKYFLFDNHGKGLRHYQESRILAEAINAWIELPKETTKERNFYQIKPSQKGRLKLLCFLIFILAVLIGFLLWQRGYFS